jgi:hypothetical protein
MNPLTEPCLARNVPAMGPPSSDQHVGSLTARWLTAFATVALVYSGPVEAEEPTGFAEFPWGTLRSELMAPCTAPGHVYRTPGVRPFEVPPRPPDIFALGSGAVWLSCSGRAVSIGGGSWGPQLTFVDDRLAGYKITVQTSAYRELLTIAVEKFGAADRATAKTYRTKRGTDVSGATHEWSWPSGTVAHLEELCGATDVACLNVMAKNLLDWFAARRTGERERAKKGY